MFFAGRPELPLPAAPETRTVAVLRWSVICLFSGMCFFVAGLAALVMIDVHAWWSLWPLLPLLLFPVLVFGVLLEAYCYARDQAERHYWTPERLRRMQPALWQLYCAGNAGRPANETRSRVSSL